MADFYSTGTVTVTGGGTGFTGTGTLWLPSNAKPGDVMNVAGHLVLIEEIVDGQHGTFAVPYPGTDATEIPYVIYHTSASWGTNREIALDTAELIRRLSLLTPLGIQPDAVGTFAERDGFDNEREDFIYLSLDGDAGATTTLWTLYTKLTNADADWSTGHIVEGAQGEPGEDGATVNEVLAELGVSSITISPLDPSGGVDGDIWFKVSE